MDEFIKKLIERLKESRKSLKIGEGKIPITFEYRGGWICAHDRAIRIANELAEEYRDAEVLNMAQMTADYNKAKLEELKRISNNGWIACAERLPENGERVLCIHSDGFVDCGEWLSEIWCCDMDEYSLKGNDVIAWMPLPEPYKSKEQPHSTTEAWKQQTMSRFERVE